MRNLLLPIVSIVKNEFDSSTEKYGPMRSAHEGYAIIKEEFDELWDVIKTKKQDPQDMLEEAIQVATMAIRFINDMVPLELVLKELDKRQKQYDEGRK